MDTRFKSDKMSARTHRLGRLVVALFAIRSAPLKLPAVGRSASRGCAGFSLEEVVVAMAICALTIGGVAMGNLTATKRAEWSSYSAAAQSAALQQLEQARVAPWDPLALPASDELVRANFPDSTVELALPGAGGAVALATNVTTITTLSIDPPIRMIRVDSSWSILSLGTFTNTVTTFRSP